MKVQRFLLAVILVVVGNAVAYAQELNARVEVNAPQVQNLNNRVVELLKNVAQDFMNNRSWTGVSTRPEERIDCGFVINIQQFDGVNEFSAEAIIVSTRPVYGTNYRSTVLSFRDRQFNFSYEEGEQLNFNENQNLGALASLLGFYANIIIGMDMDTFRPQGGSAALNAARNILDFSQNQGRPGWRPTESTDNRYWLINNLLDRRYLPYRQFSYQYHREGLDKMSSNANEARVEMAKHLEKLKEVDRFFTGNVWSQVLFSAKASEFAGIFYRLPGNEGAKVYNLLVQLDPANAGQYESIKR